MSATQDGTSNGAAHPNADTIAGLREVADWLEQHPELPAAYFATVSFGYGITEDARERLTQLARALGDRAQERRRWHESVTITGTFSAVSVCAEASYRHLVDVAPVPEPEPIIEPKPAVTS